MILYKFRKLLNKLKSTKSLKMKLLLLFAALCFCIFSNFKTFIRSSSKEKKGILIFADGTFASNALMVVPVANKLKEIDHKKKIIFLCEYGGEKTNHLRDLLDSRIELKSIKSFYLINKYSLYKRKEFFYKILSSLIYTIYITRLISKINPKFVLLSNDIMYPSRLIAFVSSMNNTRNISLQHGVISDDYFPLMADNIGVYSQFEKELLKSKYNINTKRIEIMGNPRWDYLYKLNNLKTKGTDSYIMVISQTSYLDTYPKDERVILFIKHLDSLIKKLENITFKIRLHPNETISNYQLYSSILEYKNVTITQSNESLIESIQNSKFVIMINSTTVYEALLLGKNCILCKFGENSSIHHYPDQILDNVFLALNYNKLLNYSVDLINNNQFENSKLDFISYYGNSAEQVAKYILADKSKGGCYEG